MNYFLELTNPTHGGEGWELGEKLWSPVGSSWNIMRSPQPGDIVIHSIKKAGKRHHFFGISTVKSSFRETTITPPIPGKWNNYDKYYQINLEDLTYFSKQSSMQEFLDTYRQKLETIKPQKSFYNEKGRMQPSQKYLANVSETLAKYLMDYLKFDIDYYLLNRGSINISYPRIDDTESIPTVNLGNDKPDRVTTTTERIVRNTTIIRQLKEKYKNRCQICGNQIIRPNGSFYSEGHHLKKLGGSFMGPDIPSNVIILCPNHHTEFDYGSIAIDPYKKLIIHIDENNEFNNKKLAYRRSDLSKKFLEFHLKNIFNKK